MKKFKMILLLIMGLCIAVFLYQNLEVFTHTFDLRLNIGFKHYELFAIQSSFIFLSLFLFGFLLAYFLGLGERLKVRRELRLNNEKIKKMEEELRTLSSSPVTSESATVEDMTTDDIFAEENPSEERT